MIKIESEDYLIVEEDGEKGIKCLKCLRVSYNPSDIKFKYCASCDHFHDIPFQHDNHISFCHHKRLVPRKSKITFTHKGIEYKDEPWYLYFCPEKNCKFSCTTTTSDTYSILSFEKRNSISWD